MLVAVVIAVVAVWSSIAVGVKRLHDIDKSGWWMLLLFVPIVGALALFVMNGFIAGTPHANRFGEPPSADEDEPAPRGSGVTRAPNKPLNIDQTGCTPTRIGTA